MLAIEFDTSIEEIMYAIPHEQRSEWLSYPIEDVVHVIIFKMPKIEDFGLQQNLLNHKDDDPIPTVSEVVARIKEMPKNAAMITKSQGSLADALRNEPANPTFDLKIWEQEWSAAEEELKQLNLRNDIAGDDFNNGKLPTDRDFQAVEGLQTENWLLDLK